MKRCFDVLASCFGLIVMSPILILFIGLIWAQDRKSPFYVAKRMRRKGETFRMIKLRSMVMNADQVGGTSTAETDTRITWVGRFIRKCKLDEFSQLWNVLKGDMSLVGPRPQAIPDASLYTNEENRLFNVRPGITDLSSIVFADEGEILRGAKDPDLKYNQVIRPWKSRLGLFYVDHHNFFMDIQLIVLTVVRVISRRAALGGVHEILMRLGADAELLEVAERTKTLRPFPPPGCRTIVGYLKQDE